MITGILKTSLSLRFSFTLLCVSAFDKSHDIAGAETFEPHPSLAKTIIQETSEESQVRPPFESPALSPCHTGYRRSLTMLSG